MLWVFLYLIHMKLKVRNIVVLVLVVSALWSGFLIFKAIKNDFTPEFKTQVYQVNKGYGYRIQYQEKTLIQQEYIPAIQKNQSFCNYNDAQKVAVLVVEKLSNKQNPKITVQELKQLNIQINCIN